MRQASHRARTRIGFEESPKLGDSDLAGRNRQRPIEPDIVIECTGIGELARDAARIAAPGAVVALTGISHSDRLATDVRLDVMNKTLVLGNKVLFGSVNAGRRHYDQAADALAQADPDWLGQLITRRQPVGDWPAALRKDPEDIKIVVDMTDAS